jgi:thymidylate synthase
MIKNIIAEHYDHEEKQYIDSVKYVLENGTLENTRNGETLCSIGNTMIFNLEDNKIPILTTKKVAIKTCIKELLWFIKGCTNNKVLKEQNVHIWDLNGEKKFLEKNGLSYEEDDLGPIYGHQWRFFNATYSDCNTNYENQGVDQLAQVIEALKDPSRRTSRRHVVCAWNPCQIKEMALPPCHVLFQFHVTNTNKLSCTLYQRSCDIGLGVPFNIASYSALTILIAKHCDLEPYEFIYFMGNTHIYTDHIDGLNQQIQREPYEFPKLYIKEKRNDINHYTLDDFVLCDYNYHDSIKMKMSQ